MDKVIIYGLGNMANYVLDNYSFDREKIIGGIETNKTKDYFRGIKVYSLDEICNLDYDYIWLTNGFVETFQNCIDIGIEKKQIVICNKDVYEWYTGKGKENDSSLNYHIDIAEAYDRTIHSNYNPREIKVITNALRLDSEVYYSKYSKEIEAIVSEDYFRFAILKLLCDEIKSNNVEGVTAELGVYKGRFARCINKELPDKDLYLFDTYEGFPSSDIDIEVEKDFISKGEVPDYSDTSVEEVLNAMPNPEKCIIRKGYFPDTVPAESLKYSFVSIRCGLYKPVLEGLRYFYPNLSIGGYILLSVYNSPAIWKGVKKAVHEFQAEVGHINIVPLPDAQGCVVICK